MYNLEASGECGVTVDKSKSIDKDTTVSFNSAWMDELESIRKVLGALLSRVVSFARRTSWVWLPVTLKWVWLLEVWLPIPEIAISKVATMLCA